MATILLQTFLDFRILSVTGFIIIIIIIIKSLIEWWVWFTVMVKMPKQSSTSYFISYIYLVITFQ